MTLTDLHTAVMASPGPLEDEVCARFICAVHNVECVNWLRHWHSHTEEAFEIECWRNDQFLRHDDMPMHRRPDISTDAALELVRVRFPCARQQLYEVPHKDDINKQQWVFGLDIDPKGMHAYFSERHDDICLAIIAALLKAMGA